MEVDRPTGPAHARWERASLLDIFDVPFDPVDSREMESVMRGASMLLGTPHWLRKSEPVDLWPVLTGDAGWSSLPVPPPSRADRFSGVRSEAAVGTVGVTRTPVRMRPAGPPVRRRTTRTQVEWTW